MKHRVALHIAMLYVLVIPCHAEDQRTIESRPPEISQLEELRNSIGSLAQQSQFIIRCEIEDILEYVKDSDRGGRSRGVIVAVSETHRIYGTPERVARIGKVIFGNEEDVPPKGTEVILFLARTLMSGDDLHYDTETRTKNAIDTTHDPSHWLVLGGRRGIIGGDEQRLAYLETVVSEYVEYIHGEELDVWSYLLFLTRLSESRDDRVRIDAWHYDYVHLAMAGKIDSDIIRKSRTTEGAPLVLLERFDLREERISESLDRIKKNIRTREVVSSAFHDANWHEDLASGDKDRISNALSFSTLGINHYELLEHKDVWQDSVRKLLNHDDVDVRVWAADILVNYGDRAAIRVLIEALHDPKWMRRLIRPLRRATGQEFGFNPTDSSEQREIAIRRWLEWWETEGE